MLQDEPVINRIYKFLIYFLFVFIFVLYVRILRGILPKALRNNHRKGHHAENKTWTWDWDLPVKMHFPNKALQNWFLKIKDKWFRLAVPKCLNEKTHKYICKRDRLKYGRFDNSITQILQYSCSGELHLLKLSKWPVRRPSFTAAL